MTTNQLKKKIQDEGVKQALAVPYIVFEYSTGVGKSLAAIRVIEQIEGDWYIVIAETNHQMNWIEEFKKHGKESLLSRVTFLCYQSLHKHKHGKYYVFDEIHHIQSERRLGILEEIVDNGLQKLVGLSATLSRKQKQLLQDILGTVQYHKVSLSEAIDTGILPEPKVYMVGVELNTTEQKYEFKFSEDKVIKTTQQHWYKLQSDRIEYLKLRYFKSQQEWHKVKWLKAANDRKKFLSSCKTEHAKILLDSLKDKRFICFTGSIAQSEELSNGFSVHSGVSKNLRQEMITDFNTGKVDKLFVTGMLREGQNLNNIEAGVVIQLDNNEKYYYQTQGRVLRSLAPEFYILYVKNTQDEKYTQTVLENFNMEYVTYKDLKEF